MNVSGEFRILQDLAPSATAIFERSADVVAHATPELQVATRIGLANPANVILPVLHMHAPDAAVTFSRTLVGDSAHAGLRNALSGLLDLGAKHGVTGIDLANDTVRVAGTSLFESGGRMNQRIGVANIAAIREAAQRVMSFV